jgi:hypothetical protein
LIRRANVHNARPIGGALEPIQSALEGLAIATDHEVRIGAAKLVSGKLRAVAADDVKEVRGEVPQ